MSRIVGIVPARAGSVGIPGKNAKVLAGYPLVSWTIIPALKACDVVILTTNDPEVLALGWCADRLKVQQRPDMLATPRTPDLPVVRWAYNFIDQEPGDLLLLLRPTAPFRRAQEIRLVGEILTAEDADSVRSVVPARHHPQKMYLGDFCDNGYPTLTPATASHRANHPRQGLRPAYVACGFVDAVRADVLLSGSLEGDYIAGWLAPTERALDLDTPEDWERAEALALERGWKPGEL